MPWSGSSTAVMLWPASLNTAGVTAAAPPVTANVVFVSAAFQLTAMTWVVSSAALRLA